MIAETEARITHIEIAKTEPASLVSRLAPPAPTTI
jgi:hypothetical protein